jgi:hypothetical protein
LAPAEWIDWLMTRTIAERDAALPGCAR